ncbi:MAG: STAS domain-containing protein [Candidatus Omnitrophota bacterium]
MRVSFEEKSGVAICRIEGEIDIDTSRDIKRSVDKVISRDKNKVIINLKDVNYVDSSGLATMVEILKSLRLVNGELKLTNLSQKVRGLFEITKLDKLFDIEENEENAVASFA